MHGTECTGRHRSWGSTVIQDLTALVVAGSPADLECCLASETTSGAACCSSSSCTGALVSAALNAVDARTQAGPRDCLSCNRTIKVPCHLFHT